LSEAEYLFDRGRDFPWALTLALSSFQARPFLFAIITLRKRFEAGALLLR
jgi:hypothetical protein